MAHTKTIKTINYLQHYRNIENTLYSD